MNNDPNTCVNRQVQVEVLNVPTGLAPVLPPPAQAARLESSLTLGEEQVRTHLAMNLCTQVGVLGFPDAGKTAALVSLYLLVSRNMLAGFKFRDCKTLMAFEQISRGARRWDQASLPDQVTAHTEIAAGRTAGFLHFKLFDEETKRPVEFLIPDLPGEWTSSLVDSNRTDRWAFLRAADVLWLFVDGRQLASPETRGKAVHRVDLVVKRTAELLGLDVRPPLTFVVTHRDEAEPHQGSVDSMAACATKAGFKANVIGVASFSRQPETTVPGTGLVELVKTLRPLASTSTSVLADSRRSELRYALNFRNS